MTLVGRCATSVQNLRIITRLGGTPNSLCKVRGYSSRSNIFLSQSSSSAGMDSARKELEEAVTQGVKDGRIPNGVIYAISKDGSLDYSFATGFQHFGTDDEPIASDAVFMLASQTKLLTTIVALRAVEQGFIGLDDDVTVHIPEISKYGIIKGFDDADKPILVTRKEPITLRHLVTHSSGSTYRPLHPYIVKHNAQRGINGSKQDIASTILERYDNALVFEPGHSWLYSCALDWAGLLLARVVGKSLEEQLQETICKPLGINDITFRPSEEIKSRVPQLVARTSSGSIAAYNEPHINTYADDDFGGHGGYGSLASYTKVMRSLLLNDEKLLKASTVEQMFAPQLSHESAADLLSYMKNSQSMMIGEVNKSIPLDHGLGGILYMESDVGRRRKGTLGWGGFFNTMWRIDREAGIALTFGTQVVPPGDADVRDITGVVERAIYKMAGVQ